MDDRAGAMEGHAGRSLPGAGIALACGVGALAARPLLAGDGHPTGTLVALFAALLVAGAVWPLGHGAAPAARPPRVVAVLGAGVGAFALGRVLGGGHSPAAFTVPIVALNGLAAVAEEAFFRRLAYGLLSPGGPAFAIGASALVFALVHVTVYGWWVLPIDLAAGVLLGWQRAASGRWWVPAITHVVANVLVVV